MSNPEPELSTWQTYQGVFRLGKDYFFKSEERYKASFLLFLAILAMFATVALSAMFSVWSAGFWLALTTLNATAFPGIMFNFLLLTTGWVVTNLMKMVFIEYLGISWRQWLTTRILDQYLYGTGKNKNFVDLSREKKIDNPAQRIAHDIKNVAEKTLDLSLGLIYAIASFGAFISSLWVVGGSLSFIAFGAAITIPGYMVWVAILFAGSASLITHYLGNKLDAIHEDREKNEAAFRETLDDVQNQAEPIKLERFSDYFAKVLKRNLRKATDSDKDKLRVKTKVSAFKRFYDQVASIFPYLVATPLLFLGLIDIGQLMQIGYSFGEVSTALSWYVENFNTIAEFKASVRRLLGLQSELAGADPAGVKKNIIPHENKGSTRLVIEHLSVTRPDGSNLYSDLTLELCEGENIYIQAKSGFGKSTLLKVLAKSWYYGEGQVTLPPDESIYFLAQFTTMPKDTIKKMLTADEDYPDAQCEWALKTVGLEHFLPQFRSGEVGCTFSGGEKNRLAFARALLIQPKIIFLDESTASLDIGAEAQMYGLFKGPLAKTTFISVAHRPSVEKYHSHILTFTEADAAGHIQWTKKPVVPEPLPARTVPTAPRGQGFYSHAAEEKNGMPKRRASCPFVG